MSFGSRVKQLREPEPEGETEVKLNDGTVVDRGRFFRADPVDRDGERNGYDIEEIEEPTVSPENVDKTDPVSFLEALKAKPVEDEPELSSRMYETDNIHMKSEVTRDLATTLVACVTYARQHNLSVVEEYAQLILETFVSLERKGRTEGVDMTRAIQGITPYMTMDEKEMGGRRR